MREGLSVDNPTGWTDEVVARSQGSVNWTLSANDEAVGAIASREEFRSGSFPMRGVYLAFDRAAVRFLSEPVRSAAVQELLLDTFEGRNVLTRIATADSDLQPSFEVHGFRWCDEAESGNERILELGPIQASINLTQRWEYPELAGRPVIHLATGSKVKWDQYGFLFRSWGLNLRLASLAQSVFEPQVDGSGERSEQALVESPLKQQARFAARSGSYPLLLEDTMLFVEHFNNDFDNHPLLPGPDTKRWWGALQSEGLLALMEGSSRRRARFVAQLGVLDRDQTYRTFRAQVDGVIANESRTARVALEHAPFSNPFNFHNIFIPSGSDKTYSEMRPGEFRRFDYRSRCVDKAAAWLETAAKASPHRRPENSSVELEIED